MVSAILLPVQKAAGLMSVTVKVTDSCASCDGLEARLAAFAQCVMDVISYHNPPSLFASHPSEPDRKSVLLPVVSH